MAYLVGKFSLLALLVLVAAAQVTIPQPDPSWDSYQLKACCPKDFIEVNNYCVQCTVPNVFDSVDQRCRPCPSDHVFNNATKQCDCKVPCAAPRVLNANNICECLVDSKGNRRVYNQGTDKCECPENLPLWNGRYCVKCPDNTTFDHKENQCYHCPEGFTRDVNSHTCIPSA